MTALRALTSATLAVAALLCLTPPAVAEHSIIDHLSVGPSGGNGSFPAFPEDASADGTAVLFSTYESLVPQDTDGQLDSYLRGSNGALTLVTTGPSGGNANVLTRARDLSDDGSRVFFGSRENLTLDDGDGRFDVFEWSNGITTRLSLGPIGGNGPHDIISAHVSGDGTAAVFQTAEQLVSEDMDTERDLYRRQGGVTTLMTPATDLTNSDYFAIMSKPSGDRLFLKTQEGLLSEDTDLRSDVYEFSAGAISLVSAGPTGGNGAFDVVLAPEISADGTHVVFATREALVSQDADASLDIYDRSGGETNLVSTGPAGGNGAFDAELLSHQQSPSSGVSDDGRIFFSTSEALVASDMDDRRDLYMRSGSTITLLSAGPSGGNGAFDVDSTSAIAEDGRHAYFHTFESLSASDTDTRYDLYEWADGVVGPVSPPCLDPNPCPGIPPHFKGVSRDGGRIFFASGERIEPTMPAALRLWERHGDTVTVVPGGPPSLSLGEYFVSEDGTRLTFHTDERVLPSDTDTQLDAYRVRVGTGYPRPAGATPVRAALVVAYDHCTSPNRTHGPPLAFRSCEPPQPSSNWLTVGTVDSNDMPTKSVGSVRYTVLVGDPSTTADEADVRVLATITDVRNRSDLSDYTGSLALISMLRVTDRFNTTPPGGGTDPATMIDIPFPAFVPCGATADTTVGSTCAVDTTMDALVPGAVKERQRSIWELSPPRVVDGGGDGSPATEPNDLFMVQGLFVP